MSITRVEERAGVAESFVATVARLSPLQEPMFQLLFQSEVHSHRFELAADELGDRIETLDVTSLTAAYVGDAASPLCPSGLFDCFFKPNLYDKGMSTRFDPLHGDVPILGRFGVGSIRQCLGGPRRSRPLHVPTLVSRPITQDRR